MTETYDECLKEAPETSPEAPEPTETCPPQALEPDAKESPPEPEAKTEPPPEPKEAKTEPKKIKAALIKEPCPAGCGAMLSRHWLRSGKHVCRTERKQPRKGARPFVVNKRAAPDASPTAGASGASQPPPTPTLQEPPDPIFEACKVFQNLQRDMREARKNRWTQQMLG